MIVRLNGRVMMRDDDVLAANHRTERMPVVTVLRDHLGSVLLIAGGFVAVNSIGYTTTAYVLSYSTSLQLDRSLVLACSLVGGIAWLIAIPLAFASPRSAAGLYVFVALIWFIPDRRIERALAKQTG